MFKVKKIILLSFSILAFTTVAINTTSCGKNKYSWETARDAAIKDLTLDNMKKYSLQATSAQIGTFQWYDSDILALYQNPKVDNSHHEITYAMANLSLIFTKGRNGETWSGNRPRISVDYFVCCPQRFSGFEPGQQGWEYAKNWTDYKSVYIPNHSLIWFRLNSNITL